MPAAASCCSAAWHRGMREMDLIMGRFADAAVAELDDDELAEFERLIEVPDRDLLAWITGEEAVPAAPRHAAVPPAARLQPAACGHEHDAHARSSSRRAPGARPPAHAGRRRRRRRRPGRRRSRPRGRGARRRARDQPAGDLPRRAAHGRARARARLLRARPRGAGVPGLGLPALRPRLAACRRRRAAHDRAVAARAPQGPRPARRSCSPPSMPRSSACRRASCVAGQSLSVAPGNVLDMDGITRWLELNGFARASTVREPGDYAVRGGIIDLFAPGMAEPVRLDFFGDTLEIDPQLRSRDPAHHRPAARARSRAGRRVPAHHRDDQALPPRLCRGLRRADARRSALRRGQRGPPPSRHGALAAAVPRPARDAVRLSAGLAGRARAAGRGRRARAPRPDQGLLRGAPAGARPSAAPARPTSRCRRTGSISREAEWRERLDGRGARAAHARSPCRKGRAGR